MIQTDIDYVLPVPGENFKLSLFRGFDQNFLTISHFIEDIIYLPADLWELILCREKVIEARMNGLTGYRIHAIKQDDLTNSENLFASLELSPFVCMLSNEETAQSVENFIDTYEFPVLHLSSKTSKSAILIENLKLENIISYIVEVIESLKKRGEDNNNIAYLERIVENIPNKDWTRQNISLKRRNNYVTIPNENVLLSQGYLLEEDDDLEIDNENALLETIDTIIEKQKEIDSMQKTFIIASSSMYYHLYRPRFVKEGIRLLAEMSGFDQKDIKNAYDILRKYTGNCFEKSAYKSLSEQGRHVLRINLQEHIAFLQIVTSLACSYFSPILMVPHSVNSLHVGLENFANSVRSTSSKDSKIKDLFTKVSDELKQHIEHRFIERIDTEIDYHIKLICDLPLEWTPIRNLPMMLRFNTSRIPASAGHLLLELATDNRYALPLESFKDILIIDAINEDDDIKGDLETELSKKERSLNIHREEVFSCEEFVNTLNAFSGSVMIFNGHGNRGEHIGAGFLWLGNEELDAWKLKSVARIPPIVLLSACDTHPIDASHLSTANGFLIAGATSVLATTLEVNSIASAFFIADIIDRIDSLLSTPSEERHCFCLKWIDIISSSQRKMFIIELADSIEKKNSIKLDALVKEILTLIDEGRTDWYEIFLNKLAIMIDKLPEDVSILIEQLEKLPESLKYIQLGNPELISIKWK